MAIVYQLREFTGRAQNESVENHLNLFPNVTRKKGSKKLYTDFRYFNNRIVKSTGDNDTPENRKRIQIWVDRQKQKIADGTFKFAEAFPKASAKEKAYYAELEGWVYKAEPQNVLFKDYAVSWLQRFIQDCESVTLERDINSIFEYWLIPFFGNLTFYQITGVKLEEFVKILKHKKGKKKGKPLSTSRIRNVLIPQRAYSTSSNMGSCVCRVSLATYTSKSIYLS